MEKNYLWMNEPQTGESMLDAAVFEVTYKNYLNISLLDYLRPLAVLSEN
jgi:hypothetical protein